MRRRLFFVVSVLSVYISTGCFIQVDIYSSKPTLQNQTSSLTAHSLPVETSEKVVNQLEPN